MQWLLLLAWLAAGLFLSGPARAALPFHNPTLGYTIWLPETWTPAPPPESSLLQRLCPGLLADRACRGAAYQARGERTRLLVSELHGRVVAKECIGNFNQFLVRGLQRRARDGSSLSQGGGVCLRAARFDPRRNCLRLQLQAAEPGTGPVTAIVYIVYTSTRMLSLVGLAEPGDDQAVQAIDAAVSTLYLDDGLRQEAAGTTVFGR